MQFSTGNENISHDPGNYLDAVVTENVRELWIRKGPEFFQNKDCDFSEASRSYIELHGRIKTRNLNKTVFIRKLKNGGSVERKWLLYSPLKKSVFCYSCCLFNASNTTSVLRVDVMIGSSYWNTRIV